ncbi:MAG: hypothetical protein D3924_04115 [Candidatus Electrothrix sp. AR4]|nr:hypothetical protein [Candidatus Electrothrix sp. AR4]
MKSVSECRSYVINRTRTRRGIMLSFRKSILMGFFVTLFAALSACAPKTQLTPQVIIANEPTDLDDGILILGNNLLAKLPSKKAVVLLEPFKEASLYDEIASSSEIEKLLLEVGAQKAFSGIRLVSTVNASEEDLEKADYVFRGVISYEAYPDKPSKKYYKIISTLADRTTGVQKAHEEVWVYSVSYGRQELPVITADPNSKRKVAEIINEQRITVEDIKLDAQTAKAKNAYRNRRYDEALGILLKLVKSPRGGRLDTYRMLYLTHLKLADYDTAETDFLNMITVGFENNHKMPLIFLFESDEIEFEPDRFSEYGIWVRQLVAYMMLNENKCMHIIGHTSRQGDFDYNMTLSVHRAAYIQNRLAQESASIRGKITVEGRGETATVDGSEPDSDQNMIDRRVEFELFDCNK